MTEFTDRVEKRRLELQAKEWGNGIRYIHYNNGIEEVKYQNGDTITKEVSSGKTTWSYGKEKQDLVTRFLRWTSDQKNKRTTW